VIPAAHQEAAAALEETPGCSLDFEGGPGMSPVVGDGKPVPISIESFHATRKRFEADTHEELPPVGGLQ
jgi:nitrate reductase / nitrite oxidoreductase, beta subunit